MSPERYVSPSLFHTSQNRNQSTDGYGLGQRFRRLRRVQSHLALFLRQLHQLAGLAWQVWGARGTTPKWRCGIRLAVFVCFLFAFCGIFLGMYKELAGVFMGATPQTAITLERKRGVRNSRFLIVAVLSHHPLRFPPLAAGRSPLEGGLPLAAPPWVVVVMASCARLGRCPSPGSSSPAP